MKNSFCVKIITAFFLFFLSTTLVLAEAKKISSQTELSKEDALRIAISAYVFGYPLVIMDKINQVMTNTETQQGDYAPNGQFVNLRSFPDPKFTTVTAPNVDMLYSLAWINVDHEPYVLHVPDENKRYYVMPIISAWGNVITSIGKRTTGTAAQDFLLASPAWKGKVPEGLTLIQSPTDLIWIKGRTYTSGTPEDLKIVHAIQDQYSLTPLSEYGNKKISRAKGKFNPKIDMKTPVLAQVNAMKAAEFFSRLNELMIDNPPALEDEPSMQGFAKIGIVPGASFNFKTMSPLLQQAFDEAIPIAQKKISEQLQNAGVNFNGWRYLKVVGNYGTNYLQRALMAAIQPGATIPDDLVYLVTTVDSDGEELNGEKFYLMRFTKGKLPPVNGFWSLTIYDGNYKFSPNGINRYSISNRDKLQKNWLGSIDIYIEHDTPNEDKLSNWLPAPPGKFILMLRLYWPQQSILRGEWLPPRVKRIRKI